MSDPILLLSAGSLRHVLPDLVAEYRKSGGGQVALILGPAGLLRERIEGGEPFDLFASANLGHPQRLFALGMSGPVAHLASNRLCVLARADLGLTDATFLEVLADPSIRIGTSTPGDDPSGDYAAQMFDLIETAHPALGVSLKTRARHLLGGRNSPPRTNAAALIAEGDADVFVAYCTSLRPFRQNSSFAIVPVPPDWAPQIEYGLVARLDATAETTGLLRFLLSRRARGLLCESGFGLPARS